MRRVEVKYDGDTMIVSPYLPALLTDAAISLAIAALLSPLAMVGFGIGHFVKALGSSDIASLAFALILSTPMLIFFVLTLFTLGLGIKTPKIAIDRFTHAWTLGKSKPASVDSITHLDIKYTGLRGPSRYTLVARTDNDRVQSLLSTGYTGSREELVALSQLISDFTNRPDLSVR